MLLKVLQLAFSLLHRSSQIDEKFLFKKMWLNAFDGNTKSRLLTLEHVTSSNVKVG